MGQNEECKLLCQTEAIPKEDAEFINQCIAQDYAINWVVDGLPAAHVEKDEHTHVSNAYGMQIATAEGLILICV